MASDILIVDDEADIRELVAGILRGRRSLARGSPATATRRCKAIEERRPSARHSRHLAAGQPARRARAADRIKKAHPDLPVVIISGHGNIETAVTAIKRGAYDYIEKPFKADRLVLVTLRALEASQAASARIASCSERSGCSASR